MNANRIASALVLALLALPSAMAAACDSTPFRQFDFWLGEWQVHTPDGKLAGTNRIERQYDGCVIHEHYTTGRGYSGESLNMYDGPRKIWHQTWVRQLRHAAEHRRAICRRQDGAARSVDGE